MLDFLIFAVTFVVVLIVAIIWLYPASKKVTTVPGIDPTSKEDGNLSDILRAGSLHEFLLDLHGQFGSVASFWMGEQLVVSIASPELFKQHISVFDRPSDLFQLLTPLFGASSIKFLNGSEARGCRQLYDHSFLHENLDMYTSKLHKVSNDIVRKWTSLVKEEHVPLKQHMMAFATKISLQCIMGDFFLEDKEVLNFKLHFDQAWSELEYRLNDPASALEADSREKLFSKAVKDLHESVQNAILHHEKHQNSNQETLLVDHIIAAHKNKEARIADCLTYLAESIPTTGNLLTWCIYFLATHPTVQDKLYREVQETPQGSGDEAAHSLSQLRYLKQVLEETMRCAVIIPWTARHQDFNSEIGGHQIAKLTPVIHALGVVLQDEKLWPLPNKFDPDRFGMDNIKHQASLAFSPFGFAGKRHCPARHFVYLEASYLLSTLISKFQITLVEGQVIKPVYGLVTHPEDEIWITVEKRKHAK